MNKRVQKLPTETFLERGRKSFKDSKNPLYLLEAFLLSHQKKVTPPESVMLWLAKGFRKYLRNKGNETIDRALGLNRKKGSRSWFTEMEIRQRNEKVRKAVQERIRRYRRTEEACRKAYHDEREKKNSAFDLIGFRTFRDLYYKACRMSS